MRLTMKKSLFTGIALLSMSAFAPLVANAQNVRAQDARGSADARQSTVKENIAERREVAQTRLADAKLKACENRQKAITDIMARLADRGQKQLTLFTTIADRTESFYADRGMTLDAYDTILAELATAKTAAQSAVDDVATTSATFECDAENPRGVLSSFKESLRAQNQALKTYKTAVKNLIVGVKSVQSTVPSADDTTEEESL